MKKIKNALIHWLGGYTEVEYFRHGQEAFDDGISYGLTDAKEYADSLYGLSSDEWCNKMYEYLERML